MKGGRGGYPFLVHLLNIYVTLHTKAHLIKHGNLGETEFQKGFQRVSNSRNRVSKGFQIPETGFVKGLQTVSKGFVKSFKGFPKGFKFPKLGF